MTKSTSAPVLLLGLETSGWTCSVGLSRDNRLQMEIATHLKHIHSTHLAPFVERVLKTLRVSPAHLSALVVSAGPGSFTGLRIGYSLAKGLAHTLQIPLIEVPTLDVWAFQTGPQSHPIFPVIDAHREEVFTAEYQYRENFQRISDYQLLSLEAFCETVIKKSGVVTGQDVQRFEGIFREQCPRNSHIFRPNPPHPAQWALLDLGYQKYLKKDFALLESAEPMYMRAFKGVL